jgi:hypothetical protein
MTAGQDRAAGNDLVSGENRTDRETGTHPAWQSMDSLKTGSDRKGREEAQMAAQELCPVQHRS